VSLFKCSKISHISDVQADHDKKLFRIIAQQKPGKKDSEWLVKALRAGVDLSKNIPRIIDEGLAPLLFYHCRRLDLLLYLPESTRKLISRLYQETFLINSHFIKLLRELGATLERKRLRIIVLKGAALLNYVYQDMGLRPMEDIDIMVHPENLQDLKNILHTKGFSSDKIYPDTFKKGILHLDLHVDFLSTHRIKSRKETMKIHFQDIWERAVCMEEYGTCIYRLAVYDNIISLVSHLLKHGYRRLIWFLDIQEIIEKEGKKLDWQEMIKYFREAGAERLMLYYLLLSKSILGVDASNDVLDALGREDMSYIEKQILRLRMADIHTGTMTEILWLYQIKNPLKKIRFVLENIFPEKKIMQQIFPSSSISITTFLKRFLSVFLHILFDFTSALRFFTIKDLPRIK